MIESTSAEKSNPVTRDNTVRVAERATPIHVVQEEGAFGLSGHLKAARARPADDWLRFFANWPYLLSETGDAKLRQLRGMIRVLGTLASEGNQRDRLIEFDAEAFSEMMSMIGDKIEEVFADMTTGSTERDKLLGRGEPT